MSKDNIIGRKCQFNRIKGLLAYTIVQNKGIIWSNRQGDSFFIFNISFERWCTLVI